MSTRANGAFDVELKPQPLFHGSEQYLLGRRTLDKVFRGDLEATSHGEMLSAGSVTKGSAAYVAMERVEGKLHGRSGTFVLQHSATMNRGVPSLSITVVPDSGTGELTGLSGSMGIKITDGNHAYEFEYQLGESG